MEVKRALRSKAEELWEANLYPPDFLNPIVRNTVSKILAGDNRDEPSQPQPERQCDGKKLFWSFNHLHN